MARYNIWTFKEVDVFVDSVLRGGPPVPRLKQPKIDGDRVSVKVISPVPLKEAVLNYTTDSGEWQKRRWQSSPAELTDNAVIAHLPEQRPLVWYLAVTDERGLRVSTEHEELPASAATP